MEIPTWEEVYKIKEFYRTPLDKFVDRWEPSLVIHDPLNEEFRGDLEKLLEFLVAQEQVNDKECGPDCPICKCYGA